MNKIYKHIGVFLLCVASSCKLDGDLQNPNEVNVASADPNFIMNAIQLNFADFFHAAAGTVDPLVRMQAMTGGYRYQTNYNPSSLDNLWSLAYRGVLINNKALQPLAGSKKLTVHKGVGNILEAYTWLTLVDLFGDVPQVDALKADAGNFNPVSTAGTDVYTYALTLLDSARAQLAKTATAGLARDVYYGGSTAKWTALANSLTLKAWINISMIPTRNAEANTHISSFIDLTTGALQAGVDLVDTQAENFTYKYGAVTVPAGSRHPWYDQYYGNTAGTAGGYICNYYLHEAFGKWDPTDPTNPNKVTQDPRWRYYFYRQVGSIVYTEANFDPKAIGCTLGAAPPAYQAWGGGVFCVFQPGFFGRDHGDASGTPPDGATITCAGAYPAGGLIDSNPIGGKTYNTSAQRGQGANGAGIEPIFMGFFTDFTRAELMARAGQTATARALLNTAIANSVTAVQGNAGGQAPPATVAVSTSAYQTAVLALYDAAAKPMDIIAKEYWLALWGNGTEAYNLYRRTSAPRSFQPTLQVSSDPYFRSMVYPAVYANLNNAAVQKDVSVSNKVFWDNNPDNLN